MPGGPSETKRKRLETLESRLDTSKRRGRPSQRNQGQQPYNKNKKSSGQQAKKGNAGFGRDQHHGIGKPAGGSLPAALEQVLPPYDPLESVVDAALPKEQKSETGEDAAFVDSLLERLALENPKVASSRGALGLRQQDRNLLLDNPAGKPKKARAADNPARQLLSGTQLKALGLQHPAPEQCRYDALWPLHLMWREYVTDVLGASGVSEETALTLDLHGCHLRVIQHPNPQLVGLEGIVVKGSERSVHIVTEDDRHAVIPRSLGSELHYRASNNDVVSLLR